MTKARTARLLVLVAIAGSVLVGCVDVDGRQATHVAWDTVALLTRDDPDVAPSVYLRHDAGAAVEAGRRHARRWWDVAVGEWIDWPEAFLRGADVDAVLVPATTDGDADG